MLLLVRISLRTKRSEAAVPTKPDTVGEEKCRVTMTSKRKVMSKNQSAVIPMQVVVVVECEYNQVQRSIFRSNNCAAVFRSKLDNQYIL